MKPPPPGLSIAIERIHSECQYFPNRSMYRDPARSLVERQVEAGSEIDVYQHAFYVLLGYE